MMDAFRTGLDRLSTACSWVAGIAIFCIAVLGGLDVASTTFLGRPVDATVEGTEALMVFSAFMAMGLLHRRRAYIAVDLFYLRMGESARRVLDMVALLLMTVYFGLIAWRGWISAIESYEVGEFSNGIVSIPIYPSKFALAIGMTIGVLWCVADLLRGGRFREPPATLPSEEATGERQV